MYSLNIIYVWRMFHISIFYRFLRLQGCRWYHLIWVHVAQMESITCCESIVSLDVLSRITVVANTLREYHCYISTTWGWTWIDLLGIWVNRCVKYSTTTNQTSRLSILEVVQPRETHGIILFMEMWWWMLEDASLKRMIYLV